MTATSAQLDRVFLEEWGRRFGDAWNAHDVEAILALCTGDVVWSDAALPGPVNGHQGLRDFATATFATFPDFHVEETDTVYVSPVEPASFSVTGIDQWTFRGELLCHYVTYYDSAELARQLGTTPAPAADG